jgi:glucose dehydrogenase
MRKIFSVVTVLFVINGFGFNKAALSWEAEPTHKDITSYAAKNSVLSTNGGDYGLGSGLGSHLA